MGGVVALVVLVGAFAFALARTVRSWRAASRVWGEGEREPEGDGDGEERS